MSNELTKHPDLIKKEAIIVELGKKLKKKQTTLKSLKTRLKNMQVGVEDISRKIQNIVMDKLDEIDKLREEIADYANKLKDLKTLSKEDKDALIDIAEEFSGNDEMFGSGYAQYKEHKAKMESGNFDFDEEQRAKMRDMFQQFHVKPPEAEQKNIRKVFLKLSQKFHPDLAKNKKKEAEFHEMMLKINDAYQRNDIHVLLEMERLYLTEAFDFSKNTVTIDVLDQEIARLEREIKFIENQIDRTSTEVKNLRKSELGEMLTVINRAERAGEGFDEMAEEHDKMIAIFTQLRDALKDSVEIGGVSPKIMEIMMSGGMGMDGMLEDEMEDIQDLMEQMMASGEAPNGEEFMELLNQMATQSGRGTNDSDDMDLFELFDMEEEDFELNENPKFPIGSSVRVHKNRRSDIDGKTKMIGWEGRVDAAYFDEGDAVYSVMFDSQTLEAMPKRFVHKAIDYGEDFQDHPFLEFELIPAQPRDKKATAIAAFRKLFHNRNWEDLPTAQRNRLKKILLNNPALSDEANWNHALAKHLNFPFEAKTRGIYALAGIPEGHACQVYGIEYFDEDNGFIMSTKPRGSKQRITHPLVDLEVTKGSKKIKDLVADYGEWGEEILSF